MAEYKLSRLHFLGNPIALIKEENSCLELKKAGEDEAGSLQSFIFLSEEARVMLSCNIWTECGLANRSMGTAMATLYRLDTPPDLWLWLDLTNIVVLHGVVNIVFRLHPLLDPGELGREN